MENDSEILITGVCGFIGMKTCLKLFHCGKPLKIIGIDNLNDYYDVRLKEKRLEVLKKSVPDHVSFTFLKLDISSSEDMKKLSGEFQEQFKKLSGEFENDQETNSSEQIQNQSSENQTHKRIQCQLTETNLIEDLKKRKRILISLAAQAGVRYSLENPRAYLDSNVIGYFNILEFAKENHFDLILHASSSSVYGSNSKVPYSESDQVENQVSLYGLTKRIDEELSRLFSAQTNIPVICLRFFTVYGSFGRPDMAYFKFTQKILKGEKIQLFNNGNCLRDFTHVDDITESILRLLWKVLSIDIKSVLKNRFEIFNIGHGDPIHLMTFVRVLYEILKENFDGLKPLDQYLEFVEMQPGDVLKTFCDTKKLEEFIDYRPKVSIQNGLREFIEWFKSFQLS